LETQVVLAKIHLDATLPIREVGEHRLAVAAQSHEPAAQTVGRPESFLQRARRLGRLERGTRIRGPRADLEPVGVGLDPPAPQRLQLFVARPDRLALPLLPAGRSLARVLPLRHHAPQTARAPNSFRYASMNG